jgi:hypothetical protein
MSGEGSGSVSRRKLLDSFAVLSYLNKEIGFEKVREALAEAQASDGSLLLKRNTFWTLFWSVSPFSWFRMTFRMSLMLPE